MDIGKRIRQLRVQNDLTLEELASRTELTKGLPVPAGDAISLPAVSADLWKTLPRRSALQCRKFFAEDTNEEQVVFTENDAFVDDIQDNETLHWIVPNAQKNAMEPVIIDLLPHQET
jgi:transcriptional regulator with XRE-family HTH domain